MTALGHIDVFTVDLLAGWAWDPATPNDPIYVAVMEGDEELLKIRADHFRPDLADAGIGDGRHGFSVEYLHEKVPWSRRNLSVVRARDGVSLSSQKRSLIATGSAHVHLLQDGSLPSVAFGNKLYQLPSDIRLTEIAAWLPITVSESGDDPLPMAGSARWLEDSVMPRLLFEPKDAPSFSIEVEEQAIAGAHVRICRGRGVGRLMCDATLEVENAIGLEMQCLLVGASNTETHWLRVTDPDGYTQELGLQSDRPTSLQIAITQTARHRIRMTVDPQPPSEAGLLLYGLDVLARASAEQSHESV